MELKYQSLGFEVRWLLIYISTILHRKVLCWIKSKASIATKNSFCGFFGNSLKRSQVSRGVSLKISKCLNRGYASFQISSLLQKIKPPTPPTAGPVLISLLLISCFSSSMISDSCWDVCSILVRSCRKEGKKAKQAEMILSSKLKLMQ